jgi:hypothetical protein
MFFHSKHKFKTFNKHNPSSSHISNTTKHAISSSLCKIVSSNNKLPKLNTHSHNSLYKKPNKPTTNSSPNAKTHSSPNAKTNSSPKTSKPPEPQKPTYSHPKLSPTVDSTPGISTRLYCRLFSRSKSTMQAGRPRKQALLRIINSCMQTKLSMKVKFIALMNCKAT